MEVESFFHDNENNYFLLEGGSIARNITISRHNTVYSTNEEKEGSVDTMTKGNGKRKLIII
jgi:hypothetical protein